MNLPVQSSIQNVEIKNNLTTPTQLKIIQMLDRIESLLIEKNRKYGDSALTPTRVFSQASTIEQLKVRIDDKLSRIRSNQYDEIGRAHV